MRGRKVETVVFKRGRSGTGRRARDGDATRRNARPADDLPDIDADISGAGVDEVDAEDDLANTFGPYDSADAPRPTGTVLDLGAMLISAVPDVEFRFNATPEGTLTQVVLVHRDSALQLQVCAAPRSDSLWDELRDEIRGSLTADGASVREVDGVYGPELRAQVRRPDGAGELRLLGIDGPRWMVQAVFQGPAAVDPEKRAPKLVEALRSLVVYRGPEALPVREQLPLRLPKEIQQAHAEQLAAQAAAAQPPAKPAAVNGAAPVNGARPGGRRPSPRPRSKS